MGNPNSICKQQHSWRGPQARQNGLSDASLRLTASTLSMNVKCPCFGYFLVKTVMVALLAILVVLASGLFWNKPLLFVSLITRLYAKPPQIMWSRLSTHYLLWAQADILFTQLWSISWECMFLFTKPSGRAQIFHSIHLPPLVRTLSSHAFQEALACNKWFSLNSNSMVPHKHFGISPVCMPSSNSRVHA